MTSLLVTWPWRLAVGLVGRFLPSCGERPRRLGVCPVCESSVLDDDPHLTYRGLVFHAEPCLEYPRAREALESARLAEARRKERAACAWFSR